LLNSHGAVEDSTLPQAELAALAKEARRRKDAQVSSFRVIGWKKQRLSRNPCPYFSRSWGV
jgi:hypothetical protein